MKKFATFFLVVISISTGFCQSNFLWQGHFSYNQITGISESNNKLFASSENAIFSKDINTNTEKKITTVDGLLGETISTMYHSSVFNKTLVGYKNGLIIVINDADGTMFKAIGIIQKQIPDNLKKINHFMENNGIVYVSCDFGIVQFYLNNSEFGDTYFLGSTTSNYQVVYQTTIFNNSIYAVTAYNGIKKGDLSNPNLNDFAQWTVFDSGYWFGICTINNQLVGANTNNGLYKFIGNTPSFVYSLASRILDLRVYENQLIATCATKLVVLNNMLLPTFQIDNISIAPTAPLFTCATVMNNLVYIGTKENGVYTTNGSSFNNITPNCPIRNIIFNLKSSASGLWAVYGGYDGGYNPYNYNDFYNVNQYGISKFNGENWKNIPYSQVLGAKALTRIVVNPKNENQVYVSSMVSGLLKIENEIPSVLYDNTNSPIESLTGNNTNFWINASAFDKTGNLYISNARINNALKKFKPDGSWQAIPMAPISSANGGAGGYLACDYGAMVIDKNGTKWLASSKYGVVGYNENGNAYKKINMGAGLGNLPNFDARAVAIDNKNQLWIGTINGLRVLSSIDSFNSTAQPNANSIIILDNGVAQELMYEQWINDIVVDGANRKWIATNNSGVFLLSPNGQETIYHFTSSNSPLPSDSVLDIEINGTTGEVFLATNKGMVSFKGTATKSSENLENVFIYPNPVRPDFNGTVKISGLLDKAIIKITDIEGNLVFETTSAGGTIEWDTTAFGNYRVTSGVYMVFVSAQDGSETTVKKIMIVR
jgi:hypothetical protein